MAVVETRLPLIPAIKASGHDHFIVGDLPSIFDRVESMKGDALRNAERRGHRDGGWAGGLSLPDALRKGREGDLALVPRSDALMSKYEHLAPATRKMKSVLGVAGGVPVVPAFLAGQPMAMRRRQRLMDEAGPLSVVIDVTSSAGITHAQLETRGAACLALVRLLSQSRPVQLFVGCSIASGDNRNHVTHTYAQINTTPLDLARAAHVLTHQSYPRQMLYSMPMDVYNNGNEATQWPYGMGGDLMKKNAFAILSRVIPGETILFVPGAFLQDQNIQNPEQWVLDQLKTYGALTRDAA